MSRPSTRGVRRSRPSGKQVSAGGLEARVTEELAGAGLPGLRLGLEVTETAVVLEGPAGDRARSELEPQA